MSKNNEMPEGALDVSEDQTWKDCIACGGKIIQIRKALFTCENCNIEYIALEEDMREEKPFTIRKF